VTSTSSAPSPYARGWRAPWRGQWGGFDDGHTRLSCLARRIEREELAGYLADTPERARLRRQAARYLAMIEMVTQSIGVDPKATVRRLTALQMTADRQLARLDALGARVRTETASGKLQRYLDNRYGGPSAPQDGQEGTAASASTTTTEDPSHGTESR
jgi:hypothetical protein